MYYKVNYEYEGKKDCLYYASGTPKEERKRRVLRLKELGIIVISQYKTKNMTERRTRP